MFFVEACFGLNGKCGKEAKFSEWHFQCPSIDLVGWLASELVYNILIEGLLMAAVTYSSHEGEDSVC